ncbi:hypothetical protein [Pseudomonas sp. RA_35y_Pfl2_P32]|uniref:hypothetical protein n=1 Tax=Pseudomonas sp. RA_35y_Pfl2_P32 TaxID=3088705 RepID=UPI0030D82822
MRINPPLVALAIGAFGIGVTEFAPMGMLPGKGGIWFPAPSHYDASQPSQLQPGSS